MAAKRARWLKSGIFVVAATMLPLAACSPSSLGGASAFGNNRLEVAELAPGATYTADGALVQARAHFRNNNFGHSAALYKKVVELSPGDPEGYIGLSASYDRLGRFDLSDRIYARLYDMLGGTAQYFNNVGFSYMLRGNLTAALTNFRKAQQLDPDNVVIANNIQLLSNAAHTARA